MTNSAQRFAVSSSAVYASSPEATSVATHGLLFKRAHVVNGTPPNQRWTRGDTQIHAAAPVFVVRSRDVVGISIDHPIKAAFERLSATKRSAPVQQALALLARLEKLLPSTDLDGLPPLECVELDDGTIALEWILDDKRLGFSIELIERDSRWFYVDVDGTQLRGTLADPDLPGVLQYLTSNDHG